MLLDSQRVSKSKSLVCSPLGGELLIYDSVSGNVHVLNGTAHQVWQWLDAGMSDSQMAKRLCDIYAGIAPEDAAQDVQRIIQRFFESRIITIEPSAPTHLASVAG